MSGFTDTFSIYFFKHFPQWRGRLSTSQQENIKSFSQLITNRKECATIWQLLEENAFLLAYFHQQVHNFVMDPLKKRPGCIILGWSFSIFLCLGLVIFFKDHLSTEALNLVAVILGIFGACLKSSCQAYFFSDEPKVIQ